MQGSFEASPLLTLHVACFSTRSSFFLSFLYLALLLEALAALLESAGDAATFIFSSLHCACQLRPPIYRGKRLRVQMTQARWPRIPLKLLIRPRGLANYTRSSQCTPLCVATIFRVHLFTSIQADRSSSTRAEHAHWSHRALLCNNCAHFSFGITVPSYIMLATATMLQQLYFVPLVYPQH